MKKPHYTPGKNIAMKVPPEEFDATVAFYQEIMGLRLLRKTAEGSVAFEFGGKNLWIDKVATLSQAEIWLELISRDSKAAAQHLKKNAIVRKDEIEPLPKEMNAFWIKNPAGIIHLISQK